MALSLTLIIIIITCIVSFTAFSNSKITEDLIFYPPAISKQNQWYRFITCGLIHADLGHLAFNMFSLYLFGDLVEKYFHQIFGERAKLLYLAMYVIALVVCMIPTYAKNKDNYYYRSLGASGAVSAVVFAGIFLVPLAKIGLFIIPPVIPGFVFGPLYLGLTAYMSKRGGDNINHSAHFWGAVFGIAFVIVMSYFLSDYRPVENFIFQVQSYFN
ncbi:rhomboid family intramembrane serine protease [Danxiaibacter flavus]|uniref:Rhomboid family intramembrane serine protease n=1 Tax=Danxiaibacter flavus TaxID=3049108 RepID=A0ABV3ZBT9_9BACT|nr:rhomboid family intramembrane serine protease [Chitinophagaceae bacterium DXS]